ncbi:MAG: hypothetical protein U9Q07_14030, partial [Planctomycetota bacterium]|nr:hypothetical protein [Planctomycetota bacterium]
IEAKRRELGEVRDAQGSGLPEFNRLSEELHGLAVNRRRFVDRDLEMFDIAYADQRFEFQDAKGKVERMMKDVYGKHKVVDWMAEMFDGCTPKPEELDKIGRLFFDANGLKAVNDLSGSHVKGDEYLKRIAEVFRREDSEAVIFLKTLGEDVELVPVLGGGDEYALLIKSDRALDVNDLEHATQLFQKEIAALDVGSLVDFNSKSVRKNFGEDEIPKGFVMQASASGGAATLGEGMRRAMKDRRPSKRLIGNETSAHEMYMKTVGGLWDEADSVAGEQKKTYKRELVSSLNEEQRFYSKVLKRTEEARQMEQRVNDLSEIVGHSDKYLDELAAVTGRGDVSIRTPERASDEDSIDMSVLGIDTLRARTKGVVEQARENLKRLREELGDG